MASLLRLSHFAHKDNFIYKLPQFCVKISIKNKGAFMIKRFAMIFLLLFMTGCMGTGPQNSGYSITIPLAKINQTFASEFPTQINSPYGVLRMFEPQLITPRANNTMQTGARFGLNSPLIGREVAGKVSLSSGVFFDPQTKNVYLRNLMIEELALDSVTLSQFLTPQLRQTIGDILAEIAMKKPIYNLNNSGIIGVNLVRDISIVPEGLVVTFGL